MGQSRMDNTETMTTLGTHAEDKQTNKQQQTQHRDNDNFGYTRGRQTNKQQQTQHRKLKR